MEIHNIALEANMISSLLKTLPIINITGKCNNKARAPYNATVILPWPTNTAVKTLITPTKVIIYKYGLAGIIFF
ncbi:hypothetical protein GCM10011425_33520 [Mucilaginibacter galii]|uniref:Uncharacterized protein n=1 Tax=Mucilaginibacter galii TaxID=2005073 RepID=A0A917JCW4_9SPHI|nr:hypothetical protein GCM10011425_33520 [Mucilaginibacter galii]